MVRTLAVAIAASSWFLAACQCPINVLTLQDCKVPADTVCKTDILPVSGCRRYTVGSGSTLTLSEFHLLGVAHFVVEKEAKVQTQFINVTAAASSTGDLKQPLLHFEFGSQSTFTVTGECLGTESITSWRAGGGSVLHMAACDLANTTLEMQEQSHLSAKSAVIRARGDVRQQVLGVAAGASLVLQGPLLLQEPASAIRVDGAIQADRLLFHCAAFNVSGGGEAKCGALACSVEVVARNIWVEGLVQGGDIQLTAFEALDVGSSGRVKADGLGSSSALATPGGSDPHFPAEFGGSDTCSGPWGICAGRCNSAIPLYGAKCEGTCCQSKSVTSPGGGRILFEGCVSTQVLGQVSATGVSTQDCSSGGCFATKEFGCQQVCRGNCVDARSGGGSVLVLTTHLSGSGSISVDAAAGSKECASQVLPGKIAIHATRMSGVTTSSTPFLNVLPGPLQHLHSSPIACAGPGPTPQTTSGAHAGSTTVSSPTSSSTAGTSTGAGSLTSTSGIGPPVTPSGGGSSSSSSSTGTSTSTSTTTTTTTSTTARPLPGLSGPSLPATAVLTATFLFALSLVTFRHAAFRLWRRARRRRPMQQPPLDMERLLPNEMSPLQYVELAEGIPEAEIAAAPCPVGEQGEAVMLTRKWRQLRDRWELSGLPLHSYEAHFELRYECGRIRMVQQLDNGGQRAWVQWLSKQGWIPLEYLERAPDEHAPPLIESEPDSGTRHLIDLVELERPEGMLVEPRWQGVDLAPLDSSDILASNRQIFRARRHQLLVKKQIGRGSYGNVYRADWNGPNGHCFEVALKVPAKPGLTNSLQKELKAMQDLELGGVSHPNVLKLLAYAKEEDTAMVSVASGDIVLITEYCMHGSMAEWLSRNPVPSAHQLRVRLKLLHEVAFALAWVAERDIVHCDVKMANILIAQAQDVAAKLADFGLAHKPKTCNGCGGRGTLLYKAPEVLMAVGQRCPHSQQSDVWSLGLVAYGLLRGGEVEKECFGARDRITLETAVRAGRRPQVETCVDDLIGCLEPEQLRERVKQRCLKCVRVSLSSDPAERPSCAKLSQAFKTLEQECGGDGPSGMSRLRSLADRMFHRSL